MDAGEIRAFFTTLDEGPRLVGMAPEAAEVERALLALAPGIVLP